MVDYVLVLLVLVILLPAGHSYRQQRLLCSHTQTSPSLWSSAHSRQCLSSKSSLHAIRNPFRKYPDQPTNGLPQHVVESLQNNAVLRLLSSAYSFFYWLPRNNMLYDTPWSFLRNSTSQFLAWYQLPHNLPPYSYLGAADLPADFFCFGLPGNTLPLGNWDPMGFAQVNQRVVLKYRESELKHGRIAMLAFVGCFVQELWHPLHSEVGGLSVTHMEQLKTLHTSSLFPYNQQLEYWLIIFTMMLIESWGYVKYWKLWRADEYNHQFDHNIGLGNIAENRQCGDFGFDPLRLMPEDAEDKRWIQEVELNHGRLAMIAMLAVFAQEYLVGVPILAFGAHSENEFSTIFADPLNNKSLRDIIDAKIRSPI